MPQSRIVQFGPIASGGLENETGKTIDTSSAESRRGEATRICEFRYIYRSTRKMPSQAFPEMDVTASVPLRRKL
jgi:hypothetical protein